MTRPVALLRALLALLVLLSPPVLAVTFQDQGDGTIRDLDSGLVWDKCSWGQAWDGTNCSNAPPTLIWSDALVASKLANDANHRGYSDWRVPNIKELEALADRTRMPAVDPAFSVSTNFAYWSSTTRALNPASAWAMHFSYGTTQPVDKNVWNYYVRLVRGASYDSILSIGTTSLPGGAVGAAYSEYIAAAGGHAPYAFSVTGGALPGGLTLDAGTGELAGTPSAGGSFSFTVTVTDNWAQTASKNYTLVIGKGTPTITWSNPADISYGTALSATQLNASADAAGSFAYSPDVGTVLAVGSHTLNVTFTPTDAASYNGATASVTLVVNKATPSISWSNPANITYGSAVSATQLNASTGVAGSFAYSPDVGAVLAAGSHTLNVTFTPTDAASYNTATGSVTLVVDKAAPSISWSNPANITYGSALSGTQLNASTGIAGSFAYSPVSGTVLNAGSNTLNVTFTPTDAANYSTATGSVTLVVDKATPSISWSNPANITYGTALSATQLNASTGVAGSFVYNPVSGTVLNVGSHTLGTTFTPTDATNYNTATASATLVVGKATPTISWSNPANVSYGTALSATQLDATANTAGSFVYSPVSGTVLNVGSHTLNATFTPTDAANYDNASASVTLVVDKASQAALTASATPAAVAPGGVSTLGTTGGSGTGAVSYAVTAGGSFCTVSNSTLTGIGMGTCTVTATKAADASYNAATATVDVLVQFTQGGVVTVPSPVGGGNVTVEVPATSGGASCRVTQLALTASTPATPPTGVTFPQGLVDVQFGGCTNGATATLRITYPSALPAGTEYWKYGPTEPGGPSHWYAMPSGTYTITGNVVTLTLTDGALGDDDLTANGVIVDIGGPALVPATPVPLLAPWALGALGAGLLGLGAGRMRRKAA